MICKKDFKTKVLAVYGHIENNPKFPSPELLIDQLSDLKVNKPIFARKFDGGSKKKLTYILFGSKKQLYMAHYLTDDENSFDQIVSVETTDLKLKEKLSKEKFLLVHLSQNINSDLPQLPGTENLKSLNNKFSLPVKPLGSTLTIESHEKEYSIKVTGEVYFNNNNDLKVGF